MRFAVSDHQTLPSLEILKQQAPRLRASLAADGYALSHARALEAIAHQYGCKDWNTLCGTAKSQPNAPNWHVGSRVNGTYMSHPISGRIKGVMAYRDGYHRLTLDLDAPVDVVTSDHFSAERKQITAVVDARGVAKAKLSDGTPHLTIAL